MTHHAGTSVGDSAVLESGSGGEAFVTLVQPADLRNRDHLAAANTSSSRETRSRNRKETRETIADRIVSMPATIRRSAQNSNVYTAYGIMSSHRVISTI
jgi:hypothetical protein